jgi:hypothetical protein
MVDSILTQSEADNLISMEKYRVGERCKIVSRRPALYDIKLQPIQEDKPCIAGIGTSWDSTTPSMM